MITFDRVNDGIDSTELVVQFSAEDGPPRRSSRAGWQTPAQLAAKWLAGPRLVQLPTAGAASVGMGPRLRQATTNEVDAVSAISNG